MSLTFTVPGKPVGKGRPRLSTRGGIYTPKTTRDWERQCAMLALRERLAHGCQWEVASGVPVEVRVVACFGMPKSWSVAKRQAHIDNFHTGKPDADNILKIVLDAITPVLIEDDALVASCSCWKMWGDASCVTVSVRLLST